MIKRQFALAVLVPQGDDPDRLLRHDIACNERAFAAMHFKAGFRIFGGEGIVELGNRAGRKTQCAHHAVFDAFTA